MKTKMLLMIAALVAASMAWAVNGFTYQGTLLNEAGTAPLAGSRTIQFRLYNVAEGGTALWAKTVSVLLDGQGTFSTEISDDVGTQIGSIPHSGLAGVIKANDNLFIGLTVNNTSGEIAPRQKVLPVPSAMIADDVRNASGNFTVAGQATANSIKAATRIDCVDVQATGDVNARNLVASEWVKADNIQATTKVTANSIQATTTVTANAIEATTTVKAKEIEATSTVKAEEIEATTTVKANNFVGYGTIPIGGIIMWSGTLDDIPDGWVLCDGKNNTRDLRKRFIVGAGRDHVKGSPYEGEDYQDGGRGGTDAITMTVREDCSKLKLFYYALAFIMRVK